MARPIWSGSISFGMVNVPVKMYPATSTKTVRFNQLSKATGGRIRQKRVDETTGKEVAFEDIVKGYEISPDRYVVVDPAELEAFAPAATKTVEIAEFVDADEIDPIFYDHTYYLAPAPGGAKAYRLLLEAMGAAGRAALGRIVIRSKQSLCVLRPADGTMTLSTMYFGDEVLPPVDVDDADVTAAEARMASMLVESLTAEFDPARFRDEYREQVLDLIERKAAGEEIVGADAEPAAEPAPDLMTALEASLEALGRRKEEVAA